MQAANLGAVVLLPCHPCLDRGSGVAGLRSHTRSTLKHDHVDIPAIDRNGILYVGITGDLPRRLA